MDFDLDEDQRAITEAVEGLLSRYAGAERAVELARDGRYDFELDRAMREAGFCEIALAEGAGLLDAALLVEAVARAGGVMAAGAAMLVAPVLDIEAPGPVALTLAGSGGPVRYAAQAHSLLVADEHEARVIEPGAGAIPELKSNFGFPMGRVPGELTRGRSCWRR